MGLNIATIKSNLLLIKYCFTVTKKSAVLFVFYLVRSFNQVPINSEGQ